jgi:hypothetical protein
MLFAIVCHDKPGHLPIRQANRAAHLTYIEATGIVRMAGPFIEDGQMTGSLIVLECDSLAASQAWAAADPYRAADLFVQVSVTEWKKVIG